MYMIKKCEFTNRFPVLKNYLNALVYFFLLHLVYYFLLTAFSHWRGFLLFDIVNDLNLNIVHW